MSNPYAPGSLVAQRFLIEASAGSGGMSTVLRAADLQTNKPVAIKLLRQAENPERLLREAFVLRELSHPNIVSYVTHGTMPDGQLFLALEWLDGCSLADALQQRGLSLHESIQLTILIAETLAVAHQHGIVHRDIKPSNLFLRGGQVERVALLDFGIARRLLDVSSMTQTGQMIGTPQYMAPEQAQGVREILPATDIFSLGCVFFECICGRPPFTGQHLPALLSQLLLANPPAVREVRPELPLGVEVIDALLAGMLEKDPARRIPDAAALLPALRALRALPELPPPTLMPTAAPLVEVVAEERQLISVVLATVEPSDDGGELATISLARVSQTPGTTDPGQPYPVALIAPLQQLGAEVEILADRSIVAVASQRHSGSAIDQAVQAARCALLIKERWPAARVALSTGLGALHHRIPQGVVMERIESLLQTGRSSDQTIQYSATTEIVMDDLTASFIQGRFLHRELGPGVFALLGESVAPDQGRLLLGRPTPCLGRERELTLLEDLMAECVEEKAARAALVIAPSGVGKSRLRHEFLRRMQARFEEQQVVVLIGRGDPVAMGISYGLIGQALRQLCRVVIGEALATSQAKFEKRISANLNHERAEVRRIVEFLGEMCSVPFPDGDSQLLRAARQDPNLLFDQIGQALMDFLTAECRQQPIILILEDLHWGDLLTVRLVDAALRELQDASFMVLALARPEVRDVFPKLWSGRGVREVQLAGLSRQASERLIEQMLGQRVGSETRARLIKQAAGNVLFLEELIRATAEGREGALPESVLAMLQARLGRLEPTARRLMRMASVFGETFWLGGLDELIAGELSRSELTDLLQRLIEAELIERHRVSRFSKEVEYGFHHAMVRDAAYGMFTPEEARRAHALAGAFLEALGEGDPTVLAEHAQRAGDRARAVSFYLKASKQAYDNNDLAAAIGRAERAVESGASGTLLGTARAITAQIYFAQRVPELALQAGKEALGLLVRGSYYWYRALDVVLIGALLFGTHEPYQGYLQLLVETAPEPDTRDWCLGLCGKVLCAVVQRSMYAAAERLIAFIGQFGSPENWDSYARGCTSIGMLDYQRHSRPDPWKQLQLAKAAVAGFRERGDWRSLVIGLDNLAQCYWETGDSEPAESALRESLALIERMKEPYSIPHVKLHRLWLLTSRARPEDLGEGEQLVAELRHAAGLSKGYHGWLLGLQAQLCLHKGQAEEAERLAAESIASCSEAPFRRLAAVTTKILALLGQQRSAEARAEAEAGLADLARREHGGYIEIPLRTAAALSLVAVGDLAAARQCVEAGVQELRRQEEKLPDAAARARFLGMIPDHARLLALSAQLAG